jgi:ribosomal peptide maturation radical SAM protein 1
MSANVKRRAGSGVSTLLISMPFYSARTPSLQLGLLSAIGNAHGFAVETLHLNLDFAVCVGRDVYEALCKHRGPELGNWLFAAEAFRDEAPDREERFPYDFPHAVEAVREFHLDAVGLCRLRRETVPAFLAQAETAIDWSRYDVVGFTCTFQQNTASFALARRLKERFPHLVTLFGGANFEGEMGRELVRACPWIDYAIAGEADESFPAFLTAITEGASSLGIAGVFSRDGAAPPAAQPFARLDSLPVPDYEEFFRRAEGLALITAGETAKVAVLFESSRGCWWGQKHHCTFCGLNGSTMKFRQKSSDRVLAELAELGRRHGVSRFSAVDNIMPVNFFTDFIPALTGQKRGYDLFFEVKANMTRTQIKALSEAGVQSIQPGIESFSSHVLRLMDKGVRAIHNVNILRWARHYNIDTSWNLIWGFPDEREEDYLKQAALIPHIVHLQPPDGTDRVWLERFSPLFADRKRFPVESLQPEASLAYVYPHTIARERIAYFFDHAFPNELPQTVFEPIIEKVAAWRAAWAVEIEPWLIYRTSSGLLQIEDGRNPAAPQLYQFESPLAEIYGAICDRPISASNIQQALNLPWSAEEIAEALDLFAAKGLVMRDDELYLALAIPETPETPELACVLPDLNASRPYNKTVPSVAISPPASRQEKP